MTHEVFVAGGTGYIGHHLLPLLVERGHRVRALARRGSESRVPAGCKVVVGDPFDRRTFADEVARCDTFVQLVGVPHPSPRKAQQFLDIDLRSARESIAAAASRPTIHFVYVSVAQPAPVMRAYQDARRQAETTLAASGLTRTIVRPWYVLGPAIAGRARCSQSTLCSSGCRRRATAPGASVWSRCGRWSRHSSMRSRTLRRGSG